MSPGSAELYSNARSSHLCGPLSRSLPKAMRSVPQIQPLLHSLAVHPGTGLSLPGVKNASPNLNKAPYEPMVDLALHIHCL